MLLLLNLATISPWANLARSQKAWGSESFSHLTFQGMELVETGDLELKEGFWKLENNCMFA